MSSAGTGPEAAPVPAVKLDNQMPKKTTAGKKMRGGIKDGFLPGMEPPRFKDIESLARRYHQTKMERVALTEQEDRLAKDLGAKMREHDCSRYVTACGDDEIEVYMPETEQEVKAKTRKYQPPKPAKVKSDDDEA